MSELIRRQSVDVLIDFYGFTLQDIDDSTVPVPYPDEVDAGGASGQFLTVREGRRDIRSAGHTHEILFVAEVWDGAPGIDRSRPWEIRAEGVLSLGVGGACVLDRDRQPGEDGGPWRYRCAVAGEEVLHRSFRTASRSNAQARQPSFYGPVVVLMGSGVVTGSSRGSSRSSTPSRVNCSIRRGTAVARGAVAAALGALRSARGRVGANGSSAAVRARRARPGRVPFR